MKKLINDVSTVVPDMLDGLIALNPQLSLLQGGTIVLRADAQAAAARGEVALISGGGSGHEPAHGGYVGHGMLSAAVAGEVFTSPSIDAVLDAIRAVAGPAGALLIVKNYTGDRFNFGLAAEIARAEGILVEMMMVADDVALSASGDHAGRRGLAGTVLVHKIAGAAAARGLPLAEVARLAREATASLGTMGVALTPCTVPAAGKPGFALGDGEIEWGLGIHGEPGVARGALEPADAIVGKLLAKIVDDLALQAGERVALLVNNLGGTPPSELNVVAGAALRALAGRGIEVARAWAGTFLSALEMTGVSLTLLRIDDERLSLLDAASQTSAWPALSGRVAQVAVRAAPPAPQSASGATLARDATLRRAIEAVCECLLAAEPTLTEMDQRVGDGDLGISLARGARAVQLELDSYACATTPGAVLRGTSGPLYAVMLLRAAAALEQSSGTTARQWATAFSAGVDGLMELGGARSGDRTMVDALRPAADALHDALARGASTDAALQAAVGAASDGTSRTASMHPRRGRSSYVGERALGHADPGAHAVALWLAAIRDALPR
ncbi:MULTISPECIES: dihydroxyacetone kinase family protein [unclassified Paraburkholderia]|uniref:dihydroxyacetone kinase family protein n=1 Tax=unclassified Paraburkholderia TaxID=2615204 RepID=UPI00161E5BC6|nr:MULTISPECIES: dihydroxyacetone kinase family protein [unclassified Paraburkholderia]MBB5443666.1 dihydroxyacetone kinase [Paraburkholderia sp. WSM4177]MBB5485207.1 dihydroxyacetone kinase [Paraburkholderia sp. WSM4180]